ncbi:MAG: PaaI family thioesterase [Sphingomonas sp.]
MSEATPHFIYEDDPALPGWKRWTLDDPTRFNALLGPLWVRMEERHARVRMVPERRHSNLGDHVHGGALLGFMDVALFAAARGYGLLDVGPAVTLDLSAQFIDAGRLDAPIEAEVELLRETGRMIFLRGLVVQGETRVASFSGTVRKFSRA